MIHLRQPTREELIDEAVRRVSPWFYTGGVSFFGGAYPVYSATKFYALPQNFDRVRAEFRKIAQGTT